MIKQEQAKKCSKVTEEVNVNNKKVFKYVRNRGSLNDMVNMIY